MAKFILVIVICLVVGSLLVFTDVPQLLAYFSEYVLTPISSISQPVIKIVEVFTSFNNLLIVLGVFLGSQVLAFFANKFMGE